MRLLFENFPSHTSHLRIWLVASLLLSLSFLSTPSRAQDSASEYSLKAAFLYNFLKFTEWPSDENQSVSICILGTDPFGSSLTPLNQKKLRNQPIEIRKLSGLEGAEKCMVLFISASEKKRLNEILKYLEGRPVLTVGDMQNFSKNGGIVGFYTDNGKIRFKINSQAAKLSNLRISGKLLELSTN